MPFDAEHRPTCPLDGYPCEMQGTIEQCEQAGCKPADAGPEIVWWSVGEQERLTHETRDETIADHLEMFALPCGQWADNLPETVEVVGYARMVPTLRDGDSLDGLLEHLDEEYGDPDGGWTEPTEAMRAAERHFHGIVLAEYETWMCEPVTRETVNVREWIAAHREETK